ncbi:MAG: OmpH family outer membrane protein [Gammaproteobacteria bacterium]|nr:OmpH family outer membrane protein [Gammaproteobacteria bacterium]
MKRSMLQKALLVLGFVITVTVEAAGATRIAFVNTSELLEKSPQAEALRTTLQEEFADRDAALVKAQQQIKKLEERIARDGAIMSESEKRKLERDLLVEQRNFTRDREAFAQDLNLRQNEELQKLQFELAKVVVDVAKKGGYDLVLESGVVYASDEVNITTKVVEALRQQAKR